MNSQSPSRCVIAVAALLAISPLGVALAQPAPAPARPAAPVPARPAATPQILAFDKFMTVSAPICQNQPAQKCVDFTWRFADRNNDKTVSLAELQTIRAEMGNWLSWKDTITPRERANAAMGLMIVDSAGLPVLFSGFDSNGDGQLTQAELLADVRMDERPLGQILTDEKAVDRQRFSQRLGPLSMLAQTMMQPRPAPGNSAAPRAPVQSQPVPPQR